MAATEQKGMSAETREALEAIEGRAITVYYEDAYSSTAANDAGEMRSATAEPAEVVERLIATGMARVSTTWRPVVVGTRADAEAAVILTIKGRKALMRARTADAESAEEPVERELRRVLLALEATSCGKTATVDGNGGGAFASQPPSNGDDYPPHVRFREEWDAIGAKVRWRCERTTDEAGQWSVVRRARADLEALLVRARDELDAILHTRAGEGSETEDQRTERMLSEGESFSAAEVAVRFRTSEAAVRRTRSRHGRDPERGLDEPMRRMPDGTPKERQARALLLHREHRMSYRMIGELLSVSHETVRRDVMMATMNEGRKAA